MRRWTWASLVVMAVGLAVVLALLRPGGLGRSSAAPDPQLWLDLDGTGGWCNTIESTANVASGAQHQAAVCLVGQNPGNAPSDFDIIVSFNNALDSCTNPYSVCGDAGTARDGNPDFVGIGSGFNCSLGGLKCPYCNSNYNEEPPVITSEAFITCGTTTDPLQLSGPEAIAVITWTASGTGVDNLAFGITSLSDYPGDTILTCPGAKCHGATVYKNVTPTPLPTATPTVTPTPLPPTDTPTPEPTATYTPLPTPYAAIDKIEDTGWCDTVDGESTELLGDSHSLAVCAFNMPQNIGGFDLHITYDNGLDDCTEIACTSGTCTDDNPDLAAALGAGWDCSASQPVCDTDSEAYISCSGPASISSGPLAILNLDVIGIGNDNVDIELVVRNAAGGAMGDCAGDGAPMPCDGAIDHKVEATSTPTETATPVPPTATATPPVWAYIDKIDNGDGWCDIVDATSTEIVGQNHTLAVCLGNVPTEIEGFDLNLTYDASLDECIQTECGPNDPNCLDSNPDANVGEGWNCNIEEDEPHCGPAVTLSTVAQPTPAALGVASIHCERSADDGDGSFVDYVPLAFVDFKVIAAGVDYPTISSLNVWGNDVTIGACGLQASPDGLAAGVLGMICQGATDTKTTGTIRHRTPTPKPTATEEPTVPPPPSATPIPPLATPTPLGGVGTQLVPPETGSGSTGGGFSWLLALLAGTAGIAALAGGGFYLRFARRRVG